MAAGRAGRFLLLWDIDGTLLEANDFRHKLYAQVFHNLVSRPFQGVVSAPGFSTVEKIRRTLLFHDIIPTVSLVQRFSDELVRGYSESVEELAAAGRLLPGVISALRGFSVDGRFIQGILTCTLKAIAYAKIQAFGLLPLINMSVGAYGDDAFKRAELPDVARRRCHELTGEPVPRSSTFLIGDTDEDICAARFAGVHAVAVATGRCTPAELWRAGADIVIADLMEIATLWDYIGNLYNTVA